MVDVYVVKEFGKLLSGCILFCIYASLWYLVVAHMKGLKKFGSKFNVFEDVWIFGHMILIAGFCIWSWL